MKTLLLFLILSSSIFAVEKEYNAILSFYCSCKRCCSYYVDSAGNAWYEYDSFEGVYKRKKIVGQTASGKIAKEGVTIAAPRNFPFGTKFYLADGTYIGTTQDRGSAIVITNSGRVKIDVYISDHKRARELGVKKVMLGVVAYPDQKSYKERKRR